MSEGNGIENKQDGSPQHAWVAIGLSTLCQYLKLDAQVMSKLAIKGLVVPLIFF